MRPSGALYLFPLLLSLSVGQPPLLLPPILMTSLLHHYTTADGLLGIVRDRAFLATDARFLNDGSELSHGAGILASVWHDELRAAAVLERVVDVDQQLASIKTLSQSLTLFVCCFSRHGDQLSQWRAYARHASGYCIGVERAELAAIASRAGGYLHSCVYDDNAKRELARSILRREMERLSTTFVYRDETYTPRRHGVSEFLAEILDFLARAKDNAFHEEAEERVVLGPFSVETTRPKIYRAGNTSLRPAVTLSLERTTTRRLFDHVRVGASPSQSLALQATRQFLYEHEAVGSFGEVSASEVPYREV